MNQKNNSEDFFEKVVADVPKIGQQVHNEALIRNAAYNAPFVKKTLRDLDLSKLNTSAAVVISAGPGLHKFNSIQKIKDSNFKGVTIAADGSLIHCLKKGIIPDFVVSLDPHPKRIVRWFGDPNFEENMKDDDYYSRQDLDIDFRENTTRQNLVHIDLVNKYASQIKLILCSATPANVTHRTIEAGFDIYWWNPIVDDPNPKNSFTRQIYSLLNAPCMNTGGTVGTAAWVFADSYLRSQSIAAVGMDLGYHEETPYNLTQTYYELISHVGEENLESCFKKYTFPLSGKNYYTDPTYFWYRKNILELIKLTGKTFFNCTEGGTLFGENIKCIGLEDFLKDVNNGQNIIH